MADDDDDFGDFKFAPPSSQPSLINGVTSTTSQNDSVWGSFSSSQSSLNNNTFVPFKSKLDPGPGMPINPMGALPLSLFGEVDDDELNGGGDPSPPTQIAKLREDHQKVKSGNGSGFDFGGLVSDLSLGNKNTTKGDFVVEDVNEDDDEWEFKEAITQEKDGSMDAGTKAELQQAGQDASRSVDQKPDFPGFFPQSNDLFHLSHEAANKSCEKDDGFGTASKVTNSFPWGVFPGVEVMSNGSRSGPTTANLLQDKPGTSGTRPQSNDSFAPSHGAANKSGEKDNGFGSASMMTDNFLWDAFPGVEGMSNGNGSGASTSDLFDDKPESSRSRPQSNNSFAPLHWTANKSSGKDGGLGSASMVTNSSLWGGFPAVEGMSNGIGSGVTTNNSLDDKPGSSSSHTQSNDLFSVSHGVINKTSEVDIGFKSTTLMNNDSMWASFTGVKEMTNGIGTNETTAKSDEHNLGLSSTPVGPSDDLFSALHGAVYNFNSSDVDFKLTTATNNGFVWDAFAGDKESSDASGANAATADLADHKQGSSSYPPPTDDLYAAPHGAFKNSHKADVEFKPFGGTTNDLTFDAFPGNELVGNSSGMDGAVVTSSLDEDDDFGDFVDASQEVGLSEQEQMVAYMTVEETQLPNGKAQAKLQNDRGALPASLFSDGTEESSESLNYPDEMVNKPASNPRNGFSGQGSVNIHDLLSNLYSQAQNTMSVDSNGNPVVNGVIYPHEEKDAAPSGEDDDWDDNSWEFKGAVSENGVNGQPSSPNLANMTQPQSETSQILQEYIDFYAKLKVSVCFLLSCQLDELKKVQNANTGISNGKNTEAIDDEIQEAHKLIEESKMTEEVFSEKHFERSNCLDEIFEILQAPNFEFVESEYALSKKMQLAVNEWKVSSEILRHAMSTVKSLSLGSAYEQHQYASTWSKIVGACAQELRHGASIWKRASEKKVQNQILSNSRGQKYMLAIGEIYRAIELLALSAKVHKTFILFSVPKPSIFFGLLDECHTLWSSSGFEEALLVLLDNGDLGCHETAKAVINSIKSLRDVDVLSMHSCIFGQHNKICRLSLLPQDMLPDVKTVLWNGEPYFLNLANLWANLINRDPPQLPHLQFG